MAVVQSDNRFDWCDKLIEAKRNYNEAECCNIVKNALRNFKGADAGFIKDVCSRANDTFRVNRYFYPVYSVDMTITYDWDVETMEDKGDYTVTKNTHYTDTNTESRDFYRNVYQSCKPNTYVGRNDERFYKLAHVDDLDGGIYNAACVYTLNEMKNAVGDFASRGKPNLNASYLVNRWGVTVVFVPFLSVSYEYGGQRYTSMVNMHNGAGHFHYPVSANVAKNAKKARRTSLILRAVGVACAGVGTLIGLFKGFFPAVLAIAFLVGMSIWAGKTKHTEAYFLNTFGAQGDIPLANALKNEIALLCVSACGTLLLALLFA